VFTALGVKPEASEQTEKGEQLLQSLGEEQKAILG
jgi:hypothetical protein